MCEYKSDKAMSFALLCNRSKATWDEVPQEQIPSKAKHSPTDLPSKRRDTLRFARGSIHSAHAVALIKYKAPSYFCIPNEAKITIVLQTLQNVRADFCTLYFL